MGLVAKGCNGDEKFTQVQEEIIQVLRREILQEFLNKQKQPLAKRFHKLKVAGEQAQN